MTEEQIKFVEHEAHKIFIRYGFVPVYVYYDETFDWETTTSKMDLGESYERNSTYMRLTAVRGLGAFVIEFTDSLYHASRNGYEDTDLIPFRDPDWILSEFERLLVKYYIK